jgi:hypothetical protein
MPNKAAQREDYPALRAFMHGYLHQDYVEEYGSVKDAVIEFRTDSDDEEFRNVVSEWKAFLRKVKSQPITAIQKSMREHLGGGWIPTKPADLEMLTRAFEHPHGEAKEEEDEDE